MQRKPYWLTALERQESVFLGSVDAERIEQAMQIADEAMSVGDEFGSDPNEGRGVPYRRAQANVTARSVGIRGLLAMFNFAVREKQHPRILDVLGGDGLIARLLRDTQDESSDYAVLTSDISDDMVRAAIDYDLPAVRQSAQYLALHEGSFDGVLLAYGTHHIGQSERPMACAEAFRVLEPGGKLVLHDFPTESPVAYWFKEIVHSYSKTGHEHEHFEVDTLRRLLLDAGFADTAVVAFYDPYVVTAPTIEKARMDLGAYLLDMYGLELLPEIMGREAAIAYVAELAHDYFRYDYCALGLPHDFGVTSPRTVSTQAGVRLECPRVAIVAAGEKPHDSSREIDGDIAQDSAA